ncbi:hypothetical protein [Brevibacterium sp. FAM 27836]|uniref:hypothetical protein n=1 Tax=Brevibacterium sp. FAM 27836 TaxID=3446693 RepID=UPI003F50D52E
MTATEVIVAGVPVLLIIFTPLLPFANEPSLILGIPTMIVWMAALVVAIVVILQLIDRRITRREEANVGIAGVDVAGGTVAGEISADGRTVAGSEDEA